MTCIEALHHHVMAAITGGRNNRIWTKIISMRNGSFPEEKDSLFLPPVMAAIMGWCKASIGLITRG